MQCYGCDRGEQGRRAGRMPVFCYLSEAEAAAAYFYLTLYPPHQYTVWSVKSQDAIHGNQGAALAPLVSWKRCSSFAKRLARPREK